MEITNQRLLFKSANSKIYLEENNYTDDQEVVKMLNAMHPPAELVAQFVNEYEVTKDLAIPGVRKAKRKTRVDNQEALVLEYVDGHTLKDYLELASPSLREKLELLVYLTTTLAEIHQHGIIHKDLNPNNVLVSKDGNIKIIDFGASTKLNVKSTQLKNPKRLEGTLVYISPEQTGRMNRVIDYRSDLYSLGVMMYEMLCGVRPFECTDELELIHGHIARVPEPVSSINDSIPPILSAIVEKLMAKNAEDRYQTAHGLRQDLETCLNRLSPEGHIADFDLQAYDISGQLFFPEKLYGRNHELHSIMQAFERASVGSTELFLVSGYSGIGKSVLINELHGPIGERRGRFIRGKFDQLQRIVPHVAFMRSIEELVDNLLTFDEENLSTLRDSILEAVGQNAGVLTEAVPSLETILGKQPKPIELAPMEAQNRFNTTFEQFVYSIATPENPLVIFLDDLQWVDQASLGLLNVLASSIGGKHLLLIGAYRSNEVDSSHPLPGMVETIRQSGTTITEFELSNLNENSLNELISDTLNCGPWYSGELSAIIHRKTKGNCFYAKETFKSIHEEGLLHFDYQNRSWTWDLEKIGRQSVSENVGDILLKKASHYSRDTQKVLKIASSIGNVFDLKLLAGIHKETPGATLSHLWKTIEDGWVISLDNTYKHVGLRYGDDSPNPSFRFSHDKVQEAANQLLGEGEAQTFHYQIGRALIEDQSTPMDEKLFDVANQFLMAMDLLTDPEERKEICRVNMEAAKRAGGSAAFEQSKIYAETALSLLPENGWEEAYEWQFNVYTVTAMANLVVGNFERCEFLLDSAYEKAQSELDKAECLNMKLTQYTYSFKYAESIDIGREALAILGVEFPSVDEVESLQQLVGSAAMAIQGMLEGKDMQYILDLPEMEDPKQKLIMKLLGNIGPSTYVNGSLEAWSYTVVLSTKISLEFGNSSYSPYGYVQYGMIVQGVFQMPREGYAISKMACELADKQGRPGMDQKCRCYFILADYVQPWVMPFASAEVEAQVGMQSALECGNNLMRGFMNLHRVFSQFYQGIQLNVLQDYINESIAINKKNQHGQGVNSMTGMKIFTDYLASTSGDNMAEQEAAYLKNSVAVKDVFSVLQYQVFRAQIAYMNGDYELAIQMYRDSETVSKVYAGLHAITTPRLFYAALSLIQIAKRTEDNTALLEEAQGILGVLEGFATFCAENYSSKIALIKAELAALQEDHTQAVEFYKEAIIRSDENGFISDQAIANELAGIYYLEARNDKFIANSYLSEAQYIYGKWGAKRMVQRLGEKYPNIGHEKAAVTSPGIEQTKSSTTTKSGRLDLKSVIKASEVISSEIRFDKLVNNLIRVTVESAGAQRGLFIRNAEGQQRVYGG